MRNVARSRRVVKSVVGPDPHVPGGHGGEQEVDNEGATVATKGARAAESGWIAQGGPTGPLGGARKNSQVPTAAALRSQVARVDGFDRSVGSLRL